MYGYYALAALGPQMRPYLWWKRYLTQLQIAQFVFMAVHGIYFLVRQQGYAPFFVGNYMLQASIYIILFSRFYFKTYDIKHSKEMAKNAPLSNGDVKLFDSNNNDKIKSL